MDAKRLPTIIQGGMGVGVSGWRLARAVSQTGQLGVVSGSGLDTILARRLQLGDPGGDVRRALSHFPLPDVAERIIERYFVPGGKAQDQAFKSTPLPAIRPSRQLTELLVAGNFVEVFLAREGHDGPVGINFLEKIQLPTLPSLYGAMLAGVSWVLMGAGIPRSIPGVLDRLAENLPVELKIDVANADRDETFVTQFDPGEFCGVEFSPLVRPKFVAIVSSATLATMLARKSNGQVDGFVIEGHTAGGHNAPPRGKMALAEHGEPVYGDRDAVDLQAIANLGLPFWLAGSYGSPNRLTEALQAGATGIQVGTPFAYCEESDLRTELKQRVLEASAKGEAHIFTDPVASPTGFPFKVVELTGTLSEEAIYQDRRRVCDLGYLRHARKQANGEIEWLCPGEPTESFTRKGGDAAEMPGRKCLCNALMSNVGLGQVRRASTEAPLVTSGDDVATIAKFLSPGATTYTARHVVEYLLN